MLCVHPAIILLLTGGLCRRELVTSLKQDFIVAQNARIPGVNTAELKKGCRFWVNIKPNSKVEKIIIKGDVIQASVKSPPVDGKANKELLRMIKKEYGIDCVIVSGAHSRKKLLRVI